MKLVISRIDFEILRAVKETPTENNILVKSLISLAGEGYIFTRLRGLEARGYITRTRGPGRSRIVSITPAGLNALQVMTAEVERLTV